jgi:hypothetical protein
MTDKTERSKHDELAMLELEKASAALSPQDRKLHLNKAAKHATDSEIDRRKNTPDA